MRTTVGTCLILVAGGCSDFFGVRLEREVGIEVDPTVVRTVEYRDGRPDEVTTERAEDLPCRQMEPVGCFVHEILRTTIWNDGSESISYHPYGCYHPLRRIVGGVLEPVRRPPCVAMAIPPVEIAAGGALEVPIYLYDEAPGTYRVWFNLSDLAGQFDERSSLSSPFELVLPE